MVGFSPVCIYLLGMSFFEIYLFCKLPFFNSEAGEKPTVWPIAFDVGRKWHIGLLVSAEEEDEECRVAHRSSMAASTTHCVWGGRARWRVRDRRPMPPLLMAPRGDGREWGWKAVRGRQARVEQVEAVDYASVDGQMSSAGEMAVTGDCARDMGES